MYAILNCLSNYDKQNPKDWNRGSDVEYMYEEWDVPIKYFGESIRSVCPVLLIAS
jgi:hypothetical protein